MRPSMRRLTTITALSAMTATATATAGPAATQGPTMHQVRYTVSTDAPFHAKIYYRDAEPAVFSDYSHNPYLFSPMVEADVGPDQPWVLETQLADPTMWAMVLVQSAESPNLPTPAFNCELAVDGVVVKTHSGAKGALCSIRSW